MKRGEMTMEQFHALTRVFFTNDWTNADEALAKEALGNMQTGTMSFDELDEITQQMEQAEE